MSCFWLAEYDTLATTLTVCIAVIRAQVATQLKELVQQQHRQLTQFRWGGQAAPHSHQPLPGLEAMHAGQGQGDEMSELRALIHSLRCVQHHAPSGVPVFCL